MLTKYQKAIRLKCSISENDQQSPALINTAVAYPRGDYRSRLFVSPELSDIASRQSRRFRIIQDTYFLVV